MGSKKLKAVVVTGNEKIKYHNYEEFRRLARELTAELRDHPNAKKRYELGTIIWIKDGHEIGHFLRARREENCLGGRRKRFKMSSKVRARTLCTIERRLP